MTKSDFLERLAAELKRHHVSEPDEIIDEYREHFAFKLADGYSEEEIATKLGAPGAIAAQYVAAPAEGGRGKKAITAIASAQSISASASFACCCTRGKSSWGRWSLRWARFPWS
ncbi:MAG TPA: DUF1700 domain-containing protein [Candidatus Avichristensenella intestinipullorum]|uniref:DUF1700 domain-containing protein n=1 Tax=Candidatus Avichristensenella intestinipullorum TaxID=2840693 RepID=A0A9D0YXH7_9FIRM|nr:DUF1700 domain-containing protein [Candidatus Avichristensenella intestinipullorum]